MRPCAGLGKQGHWAGRGQEQCLGGSNLLAVRSEAALEVVLGCMTWARRTAGEEKRDPFLCKHMKLQRESDTRKSCL